MKMESRELASQDFSRMSWAVCALAHLPHRPGTLGRPWAQADAALARGSQGQTCLPRGRDVRRGEGSALLQTPPSFGANGYGMCMVNCHLCENASQISLESTRSRAAPNVIRKCCRSPGRRASVSRRPPCQRDKKGVISLPLFFTLLSLPSSDYTRWPVLQETGFLRLLVFFFLLLPIPPPPKKEEWNYHGNFSFCKLLAFECTQTWTKLHFKHQRVTHEPSEMTNHFQFINKEN